jgi:SEC-C motif-containing protein
MRGPMRGPMRAGPRTAHNAAWLRILRAMQCYCGTGRDFEECCEPYLKGSAKPETAEALMRSRYSAYATDNIDYVMSTHDPATIDAVDREGAQRWARESAWQGLEIVETVAGGPGDDTGVVEFVARYESEDQAVAHHERAQFRRIDGSWFYIDGEMVKAKPTRRETPKVGRNEPCPCGSGKKYKKCHGA